jgi:hypothetical protein
MNNGAHYEWQRVTEAAAFPPRDGAGALVYQDRMWLIGGWNPDDKVTNPIHSNCNNEVWNSPDGKDWTLVRPNTHLDNRFDPAFDWEARHTAGYVVHQGKMWIVGGDPLLGHYQSDVWNSEDGRTWKRVTAEAPWAPRCLHYTAAHDGLIWVMGGQPVTKRIQGHVPVWTAPTIETHYNDVWNSRDGVTWTRVTEHAPWSPRGQIGGSAVKDGRLWILGGGTYYTDYFADVWSSADGLRWERHTEKAPWRPRQYHDVAVFDGRLWILEGVCKPGGNANDVWFSDDGARWEELPGTPWAPRHAASVFVFKGALWIAAGNHMGRDVWKLERRMTGSMTGNP